jgi:hypothetical protein
MNSVVCEECQAIYRELKDAVAASSYVDRSRIDLLEWLEQLDEAECTQMRDTSPLWKAWRRLQEHRVLTGHSPAVLVLPPSALSPN